jgi:hypothetical protein
MGRENLILSGDCYKEDLTSMYELLQAEERHTDQLVPLIASTGYWDFGLKNNTLNIGNREFMRRGLVSSNQALV